MGNSVKGGYITTASLAPINIDVNFEKFAMRHDPIGEMSSVITEGIKLGIARFAILLDKRYHEMLIKYGLGDSDMASNYIISNHNNTLELRIGTDYAIYVEYGTGFVGSQHPHTHPQISWEYDVNARGEFGWYYLDENGDGLWHWTLGQKSRPFMYDTWYWARTHFTSTIDGQIRQAIKRWGVMVNS